MRPLLFIGFAIAVTLFSGCKKDDQSTNPDQIVGSGKLVSEERTLDLFAGIQVTGMAKVFIRQDTVQNLRIEADDNIMDKVTTSVNNGVLSVGLKEGSYSNITVNVYTSMKTVSRLECIGAAEFSTDGQIHSDSILCRITGSAKITLKGTATSETVEITGAGEVYNFDLAVARCSASISGTGNIEVNVTQELNAAITGAGTIVYSGNPSVIHQVVTGVGTVKARP